MPRRRALTDAQGESLLALPSDEPLLVQHWSLNKPDLDAIERQRERTQSTWASRSSSARFAFPDDCSERGMSFLKQRCGSSPNNCE